MALDEKILKKVFNKPKKAFSNEVFLEKSDISNDKGESVVTKEKPLNHYRVFDVPEEKEPNMEQIQDKPRTISGDSSFSYGFKSLVGLQKEIALFIYNACKESRDKSTAPISISYLSSCCHTTSMSVQKTVQRLEKKNIVKRVEFKCGRGGWTRYELPEDIHHEILLYETQDKLRTTPLSTASSIDINPSHNVPANQENSVTLSSGFSGLPTDWKEIDHSALDNIGFRQEHIIQIYNLQKYTAKNIQDSINYFAFDLQYNNKASGITKSPLGYFMGILRKNGIYIPPDNYESPEDKALREIVTRQKEEGKKRLERIKEIYHLTFQEWLSGLMDSDIREFYKKSSGKELPETGRDSGFVKGALGNIFRETVWEEKRKYYGINIVDAKAALDN